MYFMFSKQLRNDTQNGPTPPNCFCVYVCVRVHIEHVLPQQVVLRHAWPPSIFVYRTRVMRDRRNGLFANGRRHSTLIPCLVSSSYCSVRCMCMHIIHANTNGGYDR